MCQDIEHGGARCPSDTSAARRHRRKASTILSSSSRTSVPAPAVVSPVAPISESMANLISIAEDLKEKVYGEIPEGETQASWDSKLERRITGLGESLGKEADKIAGFDKDALDKSIRLSEEEFYGPQNKITRELEEKHDEAYEQWDEIVDKYELSGTSKFGFFGARDLTDEQKALLNDEDKEFVKEFIELEQTKRIEQEKYREIDKDFAEHKERMYTEANKKLAEAYIKVLSQVRPLGGKIKSNEKNGDLEAQKLLADTVGKNYPKEWLEHHNTADTSNFTVQFDPNRPNYNPAALSDIEEDEVNKNLRYGGVLSFSNAETAEKVKNMYTSAEGDAVTSFTHVNHWNNTTIHSIHLNVNAEELYDEKTHGSLVDGKPEGDNWVYKTSPVQTTSIGEQEFAEESEVVAFLEKKTWVRPITSKAKEVKQLSLFSKEVGKEIADRDGQQFNLSKGIAYHEFGHRMEEVLPNNVLPRQEKAFLARRTGKTTDNWRENMVETGFVGEFGHDANLVTKYAGRDYFTDNNYEVFTVGIEALYGGNYGGLMGNTKNYLKEDIEHRGFVLGVLASL
jgi:hypothetical protein